MTLGTEGKRSTGRAKQDTSQAFPEPYPYPSTTGRPWHTLTPFWGPPCCSAIPRKDCRGVLQPVRNEPSQRALRPQNDSTQTWGGTGS